MEPNKKLIEQALMDAAMRRGVPMETILREIEADILAAARSGPEAEARWAAIPRAGALPTAEEFLCHLSAVLSEAFEPDLSECAQSAGKTQPE